MEYNIFQTVSADFIFVIIDAKHSVEKKLLLDWVEQSRQAANFQGELECFELEIADEPESAEYQSLQQRLTELPADAILVPARVAWKSSYGKRRTRPRILDLLLHSTRRPSWLKAQWVLRNNPRRAQCVFGTPASLVNLTERYEAQQTHTLIEDNLASYIIAQASLALEVAERRFRGVRYKVPRQVAKQIRASERYRQGLKEIAKQQNVPEKELREQALGVFKELVSIPHNFWQDVIAVFFRKVISLGYEKELVMDQQRLQQFRKIVKEQPTVLLWTHKTHMDGLAMQSILFENDFPTPHIVGGINMAFAGLGYLAKRAGAIFIRRSFQDDLVYKLVLRNYLAYLLEKRFPLTWAFEGTRSRVGKLMPPRYGILKYVMNALEESSLEKLHIIPVAINYDMINDVKDYSDEQSGGTKRPESLSWMFSYLKRMRRPLGRIYVDFGDPVIVDKNALSEDELALNKIAFQVGVEANRVTPITLTSSMAMSLLGAAPRAQTVREMRDIMLIFKKWADHREIQLSSDFEETNLDHMAEIIDAMVKNGVISCYTEGKETVYFLKENQHMQASYYRNSIVHHFIPKAIAELSLLYASEQPAKQREKAFWQEAARLRDLFKFEFFYAPKAEFESELETELNYAFADWKQSLTSNQNPSELLDGMQPLIAHAALRPYIEAYFLVARVCCQQGDDTIEQQKLVQRAFKQGQQLLLQQRILSSASIGDMLFKNGFKLMQSFDLVEADKGVLEKRKQMKSDLQQLKARINTIQNFAQPNNN